MASHTPSARASHSLTALWTAETIRLREALWGPLEDTAEVRQARVERQGFAPRLLLRAQLLAKRESLDKVLLQWQRVARLSLLAMLAVAIIAGIGTAVSTLGDGSRSVNLNVALLTMLGLHSVTLLLWLLSLALGRGEGGAWLGEAWLWLTRKLARGPDAALAPTALVSLLGRNQSLRWALSSVSHLLWLVLLISLLLGLTALAATRSYTFHWETTILPDHAFAAITRTLGWLPAQFGFAMPSEAMIRASRNAGGAPAYVHALWTSWLIGCVVTYGLLPRLTAFVISLLLARLNLGRLQLDETLPAYADLRYRLMPSSERTGSDRPLAPEFQPKTTADFTPNMAPGTARIVGVELPPDIAWPPAVLDADIADLGVIDTREQRHYVLEQLQRHHANRLLIVCDASQTPDRGVIALLTDLAGLAAQPAIAFMDRPQGRATTDNERVGKTGRRHDDIANTAETPLSATQPNRLNLWRQKLISAGFTEAQLHDDLGAALAWLANDARKESA